MQIRSVVTISLVLAVASALVKSTCLDITARARTTDFSSQRTLNLAAGIYRADASDDALPILRAESVRPLRAGAWMEPDMIRLERPAGRRYEAETASVHAMLGYATASSVRLEKSVFRSFARPMVQSSEASEQDARFAGGAVVVPEPVIGICTYSCPSTGVYDGYGFCTYGNCTLVSTSAGTCPPTATVTYPAPGSPGGYCTVLPKPVTVIAN